MKLKIDFQNKDDLFLLLKAFSEYAIELKLPNDTVVQVMGETQFIKALAHLNYKLLANEAIKDESSQI